MNTHEFEAKTLLKHYGISVPPYAVIEIADDIEKSLSILNGKEEAVLKIQVHAGGRGKGGGVKIAKTKSDIHKYANDLLGMRLVNNQTGPEGVLASKVLLSPLINYEQEYYVAVIIDRANARPTLIASPEGGMDIEEIAHKTPEKILTLPIHSSGKLRGYQLLQLSKFMGWEGRTATEGQALANNLVKAFLENDASLLEINPLVKTPDGALWALDAKLSIDDNALFRHPDLEAFFDPTQLPATEVEAQKHELAYIALDGNIGCMVNGAGLAMATMDIIKYYGGKPANFLDVGGGASAEKVAAGFTILVQDKHVKAILVNIFGGIMNCETLAQGIIEAAQKIGIGKPLIVRMEGTNVEQGRALLKDSGLPITIAQNLTDAAQKAVAAAKA
ncbi:MAG: ADP-forming succinate--CoA ligase subunit beta [Parachlamydiales bacterium]|jgi:succinyl-CoA synthetase beta subunit